MVITQQTPIIVSVQWLDRRLLSEIASLQQLRNLHGLDEQPPASDERSSNVPTGGATSSRRWPGHQSSRGGNPRRHYSVPCHRARELALLALLLFRHMPRYSAAIAAARHGCVTLRCTIRCAACPTVSHSESGSRRPSRRCAAVARRRRFLHRPRPLKDVNDTLGHPIGDELIRAVTQRLTSALRATTCVPHWRDEFGVINLRTRPDNTAR